MQDLSESLLNEINSLVAKRYSTYPSLTHLVNTVITEDTDLEHIITFLDQSPSGLHKSFADDLRETFERVLTSRLRQIEEEVGGPPVNLYEAVLDLHEVEGFNEELRGILTLNYDPYIESAIDRFGWGLDLGIDLNQTGHPTKYPLLKLHGSFEWGFQWPVRLRTAEDEPLWIPPGIQKAKDEYPFNLLWGRAIEILDCDVLRIVGCRLGPNDWDLISMLFTTRHTNASRSQAYRVEIINSPKNAARLRDEYPYLDVQSIFEQEPVGPRVISEFLGVPPTAYDSLEPEQQTELQERGSRANNWFLLWLVHMAETTYEILGSIETPRGVLKALMEAS